MIKISRAQFNILKLMGTGWELGEKKGLFEYTFSLYLQEKGCNNGGKIKKIINKKTIDKLHELELIESNKSRLPTIAYQLTNKGKNVLRTITRKIRR